MALVQADLERQFCHHCAKILSLNIFLVCLEGQNKAAVHRRSIE